MGASLPIGDEMLCVALALTAMLALAPGQDPLFLWDRAHSGLRQPSRLPCLVLVALAIASAVFGVMHPQDFADACGQGALDPESLFAAVNRP
jgi:hypothetical protein